jgi:glycerophosphoryl diester phosphodiesterase
VIYHDDTIAPGRCTGYVGRDIWTLTSAQVARVRCQGQPIPTEKQLVNLVARSPNRRTVLRLEAKTHDGQSDSSARAQAEQIGAMVVRAGIARRAVMQDFDWAGIAGFHRASRALRVSALIDRPTLAAVDRAAALGAYDLSYDAAYSTPALNRAIHRAGLVPTVWGIDGVPAVPGHAPAAVKRDAAERARQVERQGVRVVITNYPAAVRAALDDR